MKALVVGTLGMTAVPVLAVPALLFGAHGSGERPSSAAHDDIPAPFVTAYWNAAATCPGLDGSVLAAVGKIESDHGRMGGASLDTTGRVAPPVVGPALDGTNGTRRIEDTDRGRLDGDLVFDRAVGPMQFLPSTWREHGRDADGDGTADPHNAFDAIAGAASYLCGADRRIDDLEAALFSYNRSRAYVAQVLTVAARYASPAGLGFAGADPSRVLGHPNVRLVENARHDLEGGAVDPRIVAVLGLLADRFDLGVGVIRTGHSQCVGGGARAHRPACTISHHWYGRGVDISAVGGRAVSAHNEVALAAVHFLLDLPPPLRPDEIGLPWPALSHIPGVFSDADHRHHLHVAYRSPQPTTRP